jgi:hypothetical protein
MVVERHASEESEIVERAQNTAIRGRPQHDLLGFSGSALIARITERTAS